MAQILNSVSYSYDDVNLIARNPSVVSSRTEIPPDLGRIIVSPMSSIVGLSFTKEALKLGLRVCLHRFCPISVQYDIFQEARRELAHYESYRLICAIGLHDEGRAKALADAGCRFFIIDCANGYLVKDITRMVHFLGENGAQTIIVGNVHDSHIFRFYEQIAENDPPFTLFIRVGIGGGTVCKTGAVTGVTRGQITELLDCAQQAKNLRIIADGGVRDSGCAAKAFAAGAHFVMMGGYFARALEAETNINGSHVYFGGASQYQQEKYGGMRRHSEGTRIFIKKDDLVSLASLVQDLWGGLSSAISYSGYSTLPEFIGNGVFEVRHSK